MIECVKVRCWRFLVDDNHNAKGLPNKYDLIVPRSINFFNVIACPPSINPCNKSVASQRRSSNSNCDRFGNVTSTATNGIFFSSSLSFALVKLCSPKQNEYDNDEIKSKPPFEPLSIQSYGDCFNKKDCLGNHEVLLL